MQDSRLPLVLAVESFALYARYLAFIVLAPLFFLRPSQGDVHGILGVGFCVFVHNLFTHWVFYTKRFHLFMSKRNVAINIAEATAIVLFTGGSRSEGFLLYLFILIGAGAYLRDFKRTMLIAGLCIVAFAAAAGVDWRYTPEVHLSGVVGVKMLAILVTGWLVGAAGEAIYHLEFDTITKSQELAASQETLRTILDSTADPIFVFDNSEIIMDANNAACEFLKVSREELLGKRIRTFLFDDGTLQTKFASLRAKGKYRGEQIIVDARGEERTVDQVIRKFMRDDRPFYVALFHDVTEQKNLQEAARLANADLERLNRELRQVDDLKTGLLKAISHRLVSPLSALLGYTQMLLDEELGEVNPDQRNALLTCRRSATRLNRVVNEALHVGSRIQPVDPDGIVQAASEMESTPLGVSASSRKQPDS